MGHGVWTKGKTDELTDFEAGLYNEWVSTETHSFYNHKTTVLVLKLKSGFEIVGTSGCEDPSKFSEELGRLYALKDALANLSEFTAFYRAQQAYEGKQDNMRVELPLEVRKDIQEEVRVSIERTLRELTFNPFNSPFRP